MPDEHAPEPSEPAFEPSGRSRRPSLRSVVAAVAAVAIVAGGIAVAVGRGGHTHTGPALHLARQAERSGAALAMPIRPVSYRLDGTLADLGSTAPVYKIVAPAIDTSTVSTLGRALGLTGDVHTVAGGFQISDASSTLTVQTPGSATVLYEHTLSGGAAGSPGSTGSAGGGSTNGSGAGVVVPPIAPVPPIEVGPPVPSPVPGTLPTTGPDTTVPTTTPDTTVPTTQPPPAPSGAEAQRVATDLLGRMGVLGDPSGWNVTVADGDSTGVVSSCPVDADCPAPPPSVVTTRIVTFARVIDGVEMHPGDWSVAVAANDRIDSLSGTLGTLERVGDYPLRSTRDVFDDLAHNRAIEPGPQPLDAVGAAEPQIGAGTAPVPVPNPTGGPSDTTTATGGTLPPDTLPVTAFTVSITGVELGYSEWLGSDGAVTYVVPTYRFATRDDSGTIGEIEVLALTDDALAATAPTPPTGIKEPVTGSPGSTEPGAATPGTPTPDTTAPATGVVAPSTEVPVSALSNAAR